MAASSETAFRKLIDYPRASATAEASFILKILQDRAKDGAMETAARQGERAVRGMTGKVKFSDPPSARHFHLKDGVKGELLDPKKWLTGALTASDSSWHKALGRVLEGGLLLAEQATPIGRAASAAFYLKNCSDDWIDWHQKQQNRKLALEHDLAFSELRPRLQKCVEAMERESRQCCDVKAHVKGAAVGLKDSLLTAAMAMKIAQEVADPRLQGDIARAAYRVLATTAQHRSHIHYIDEQILLATMLRWMAPHLADLVRGWIQDPETIPYGELPYPPYPHRTATRWLDSRCKVLEGFERRLHDLHQPLADAQDALEGEKFLVTLALGLKASLEEGELQQVRRGKAPGIRR